MSALLDQLSEFADIELGVATVFTGYSNSEYRVNDVDYFVVNRIRGVRDFFWHKELIKCAEIVKKWKPDLIHIHGTEGFYGLMRRLCNIDVPTVISIQGILSSCSEWHHTFGDLSFLDVLKTHRLRDLFMLSGTLQIYRSSLKAAKNEKVIIRTNNYFIGRTEWDKAWIKSLNPDAKYHHIDEILRPTFYNSHWDIKECQRHSLIFTNAGHPRRGIETLLRAMSLLKNDYPDLKLRLAGNVKTSGGYGKIFWQKVKKLGVEENVELLGYLDEVELANSLKKSHIFVLCSFIENSPNSLCEAMIIGMPCIASNVGGITSILEHGKSGLLFPAGDAPMLAGRIRNVFESDNVASKLGLDSYAVAKERHDPKKIVRKTIDLYRAIILQEKKCEQ